MCLCLRNFHSALAKSARGDGFDQPLCMERRGEERKEEHETFDQPGDRKH